MSDLQWSAGFGSATLSSVFCLLDMKYVAVFCGLMCIGFWLEGLAQVIKDKQA